MSFLPLVSKSPSNSFENLGDSLPFAINQNPSSIYVASTNTTWFSFSGYQTVRDNTQGRCPMVCTYNHTTGKWLGPFKAGINGLPVNDIHGVSSLVRDSAGYIYIFYGCHSTQVQISCTAQPDDPSLWLPQTAFGSAITFPGGVTVGSNVYLFYTTTGISGGSEGSLSVIASSATGKPSFGAAKSLADSNGSSNFWWIPGNHIVNGTDIHLVFGFFDFVANQIQDVFYMIYDTTTGNVSNFDKSVTVVPASQPVLLATAQASFRVVNQTTPGHFGNIPNLSFDGAGASHIIYADSTVASAGAFSLMHTENSGSGWSTPFAVHTYGSAFNVKQANGSAIPNAAGGVDVYYGDGAGLVTDPFDVGLCTSGNILKRTRSSGGSWGGESTAQALDVFPLDQPIYIPNSHVNARTAITEVTSDLTTIYGGLRGWAIGDAGYLTRPLSIYQPETDYLVSRMSSAPSAAYISAIDTFIVSLKNAGVWWFLDALYVMAANDTQAAKLNWVTPHFDLTVGGGAPTFTRNIGYTCNGTTDFLTSGFNPSTNTFQKGGSNNSIFGYFPSLLGTTNAFGAATAGVGIWLSTTSTVLTARIFGTPSLAQTVGNGIGFYGMSRTVPTSGNVITQVEGSALGPSALATSGAPNTNYIVGGIATGLLHCQTSMAGWGASLSAGQLTSFRNAYATYHATVAGL